MMSKANLVIGAGVVAGVLLLAFERDARAHVPARCDDLVASARAVLLAARDDLTDRDAAWDTMAREMSGLQDGSSAQCAFIARGLRDEYDRMHESRRQNAAVLQAYLDLMRCVHGDESVTTAPLIEVR